MDSRCAFPLIALQYNELTITITLRPIQELFQVRDVFDVANNFPYVQPDFNVDRFQMYRFLSRGVVRILSSAVGLIGNDLSGRILQNQFNLVGTSLDSGGSISKISVERIIPTL